MKIYTEYTNARSSSPHEALRYQLPNEKRISMLDQTFTTSEKIMEFSSRDNWFGLMLIFSPPLPFRYLRASPEGVNDEAADGKREAKYVGHESRMLCYGGGGSNISGNCRRVEELNRVFMKIYLSEFH
jgi:hypothetical protein